jgi:hypothetical protein
MRYGNRLGEPTGIPATPIVLGFAALICATVVGFESTLRAEVRKPADYGYAEALEGPASCLVPATMDDTNCHDFGALAKNQIDDASDPTIVVHGSAACAPHAAFQTTGGHHVE